LFFLAALAFGWLVGPLKMAPSQFLQRTFLTDIFTLYYILIMIVAWFNFSRAVQRSRTSASRRGFA